MRLRYRFLDQAFDIAPLQRGAEVTIAIDDRSCLVSTFETDTARQRFVINREERIAYVARDGDTIFIQLDGDVWEVQAINAIDAAGIGASANEVVVAPMPGVVVAIPIAVGDTVSEGQTLIVIESMKLQTTIIADRNGVIAEVFFRQNETFEKGVQLVRFEAEQTESTKPVEL